MEQAHFSPPSDMTAAPEGQEIFARVWRRVMPEERPDSPIAVDVLPQPMDSQGELAVPQGAGLPVLPVPAAGEEASGEDVPCLGGSCASHGALLQAFVDGELADWRAYQHLARRASGIPARTLAAMAADERRHAKRLSTAYFLISGIRYWPADKVAQPARGSLPGELRAHFLTEQRGESAYRAAAEDTADPCLRQLYLELADEENAHAWTIRGILEQM